MTALIRTETMTARMRSRIIRPGQKELLITRLAGSAQEGDLSSPVNCGGLGRVRHFRRDVDLDWPDNFLPLDPAGRALKIEPKELLQAQVFQNAGCAWRCWYCYVPFELLGGDERHAEWVTAEELVRRYAMMDNRPPVLDLSGGSPDLTPEWVPWTLEALSKYGIADSTYLWSDDNLSNDLVFEVLSESQRRMMVSATYGRVCCFKGFDPESFSFNTGAEPSGFDQQFRRFALYIEAGIDVYAYATFTGPTLDRLDEKIDAFMTRLLAISPKLPGRTVILRIEAYGPTVARNAQRDMATALAVQDAAAKAWTSRLRNGAPKSQM